MRSLPAAAGEVARPSHTGDMTEQATIVFHGNLAELASGTDASGLVRVGVAAPRSVKDAIESCGVPHTEADVVLVDARSVTFGHRLAAGDRVDVHPPGAWLGVTSLVRPAPLPEPRFVLDVHLGRLAERLRLLGLDSEYRSAAADEDLAAASAEGARWLLSRDRGLLMRRAVTHGYLVRSCDPRTQTVEVVRRFELADRLAPFTRCARCNGVLEVVAKAGIAHRLPPATRREHDAFVGCQRCGQLYWKGSHVASLRAFVADVRAAVAR